MYCHLWLQYIQAQKLFKGGNYSRAETICGNPVLTLQQYQKVSKEYSKTFFHNQNQCNPRTMCKQKYLTFFIYEYKYQSIEFSLMLRLKLTCVMNLKIPSIIFCNLKLGGTSNFFQNNFLYAFSLLQDSRVFAIISSYNNNNSTDFKKCSLANLIISSQTISNILSIVQQVRVSRTKLVIISDLGESCLVSQQSHGLLLTQAQFLSFNLLIGSLKEYNFF